MQTFQKPLTKTEEEKYISELKDPDPIKRKEAKEILIKHNMRLVAHIVKKYQNVNEETDDLLSIGCMGLIKAIDSFEANKGRFATYACRCIDNEILMMLRAKKKTLLNVSLYESIGQDKEGNEIRLMDVLEEQQNDVIEDMERKKNIRILQESMRVCLTKREREILEWRYGLGGREEVTQQQIGDIMGISRSYVSRIEKKALTKLRERFPDLAETRI